GWRPPAPVSRPTPIATNSCSTIAERCDEVARTDRDVVTTEAITTILAALGEVEPALGADATAPRDGGWSTSEGPATAPAGGTPASWRDRKLYRLDDREDSMIAGVAAGIAAYLNVDVTIIRVAWIILTFITGGVAIPLYIVLAFVLPKADTPEKRAAAHGSGTTAQEMISRARDGAGPALQSLGSLISNIARILAKVVHVALISAIWILIAAWAVQVTLILVNGGGVSSAFDPGTGRGLVVLWVSCFAWIAFALLLALNSAVAHLARDAEHPASRGRNLAIGWSSGVITIFALLAIAAIPASNSRQLADLAEGHGVVRMYGRDVCVDADDHFARAGISRSACDEFVELD
ncbi:MAG: phage shock protein PspC, partial [Thermoleophilia bacterium]|nr:phage shock protein PspC [Thermoleophilia bacterium]